MINAGLTAGLTKRLTNALGGGATVVSNAITYPTTALIQAEIYPDGLALSGSNVTGWTAAVGVNLTPTGTVTNTANGVNFAASSALTHSNIAIAINTPFTLVLAAYRATGTSTLALAASTNVSSIPNIGLGGAALYIQDDAGGGPGNTGFTISTTGKQYIYVRRAVDGTMYYGGTGLTDTVLGGGTNYNSSAFTFNSVPRSLYDTYDATTANMSRFIYSGTGGDIVTSGAITQLVAYLVAQNGVAT